MYVPEPCVKYPCGTCGRWITAPQATVTWIVCAGCRTGQTPERERMQHFSLSGRSLLLGDAEWVEATAAARRLEAEREEVSKLRRRYFFHIRGRAALTRQMTAIEAAIALCGRLSSR
jgi:hypothetical protein